MSTVRVFVCSAYRDMQAERQYLHETIFPRVQARCQEAGITFEVVDPRHTAQSEEQAEGIDGLDQALNDVDSCRPYFLGLLGGHYSRIYIEIPHEVGLRHDTVRHFFRCSRTHLEILYGVLKSLENAKACFYVRKPDVLQQIPEMDRKTYEADTEIAKHKLFMMKRSIGAANQTMREYDAQWDDMQKKLVGLEAFGEMVAADLLVAAGLEAPAAEVPVEAAPIMEAAPMAAMPMDAMPLEGAAPLDAVMPMDDMATPFEPAAAEAIVPIEDMQVMEEAAPAEGLAFGEEQPMEIMEAPAEEVPIMEEIIEEESQEVILSEDAEAVEEDIDLASIFEDDKKKR